MFASVIGRKITIDTKPIMITSSSNTHHKLDDQTNKYNLLSVDDDIDESVQNDDEIKERNNERYNDDEVEEEKDTNEVYDRKRNNKINSETEPIKSSVTINSEKDLVKDCTSTQNLLLQKKIVVDTTTKQFQTDVDALMKLIPQLQTGIISFESMQKNIEHDVKKMQQTFVELRDNLSQKYEELTAFLEQSKIQQKLNMVVSVSKDDDNDYVQEVADHDKEKQLPVKNKASPVESLKTSKHNKNTSDFSPVVPTKRDRALDYEQSGSVKKKSKQIYSNKQKRSDDDEDN